MENEAVEKISRFYRRYHSHEKKLKEEFQDILLPGGEIVSSGPFPGEVADNDFVDPPRLVLDYDRRDFGRLKNFIDAANEF